MLYFSVLWMFKCNGQYKDDLVRQPTSPTPGDRIADEENRVQTILFLHICDLTNTKISPREPLRLFCAAFCECVMCIQIGVLALTTTAAGTMSLYLRDSRIFELPPTSHGTHRKDPGQRLT